VAEEVGTFGGREARDEVAERVPQRLDGADRAGAQRRLPARSGALSLAKASSIGSRSGLQAGR
jgi:hypothetical protein